MDIYCLNKTLKKTSYISKNGLGQIWQNGHRLPIFLDYTSIYTNQIYMAINTYEMLNFGLKFSKRWYNLPYTIIYVYYLTWKSEKIGLLGHAASMYQIWYQIIYFQFYFWVPPCNIQVYSVWAVITLGGTIQGARDRIWVESVQGIPSNCKAST